MFGEEPLPSDSSPVLKTRRPKKKSQHTDSPCPVKRSMRNLRPRSSNVVIKTPDTRSSHCSSSSAFDSGIESSCDKAKSGKSTRKTRTRLKNSSFTSPKPVDRLISRSTPFSKKKQPKDSDSCFGFAELFLEDEDLMMSPVKENRNSWLWSDDIEDEETMPDPGLSPIKESNDEGNKDKELELNVSLFDENFDIATPTKLTSSAKTYAKRSNQVKRNAVNEIGNLSGYVSDGNTEKVVHKRRKINKVHEEQVRKWERKINLEFEEIDQFNLCVE